ncbi:DedA family protein [Gloeobacter violaceus]|uniref:Glr0555 protein n=1 Tax=Gloeobacter violaceus (strain ATCC 29082 / PCC 7421) TaxID=251221 RepID=Q7NN59_GLOVI|nr:DedA family protein [Gloeobacter violaceus]BAC88496.1 glr0555 [Gloeobacter violaceus PCC 7421]
MLERVIEVVGTLGYLGIAALMFLETVVPPIPSEAIMPLAGVAAAQGKLNLLGVVVSGTIGALLGNLLWYYLGRRIGPKRLGRWADRYGRWFGLSARSVDTAQLWFARYGAAAVFLCRMVPGIRTWISLPAGAAGMSLVPFLLCSALGTLLWTALLAWTGLLLENNYRLAEQQLGPLSAVAFGGLLFLIVLWKFRRKNSAP